MPFIETAHTNALKKDLHTYALHRREVIKDAGDALHHAKRAIFSLHRSDIRDAKKKLKQAEQLLTSIEKKLGKKIDIHHEGSYNAAVEEYVEATLFWQFLHKEPLGPITNLDIKPAVYIAGLCDLPGELYRFAIISATNDDQEMVHQCAKAANDIIGELMEFNLTSYLRNKFDQAKSAAHKLEKVVYDLSLKR